MRYTTCTLLAVLSLLGGCLTDSEEETADTPENTVDSPVAELSEETSADQPADLPPPQPVATVEAETPDELVERLNLLIADTDDLILDTASASEDAVDLPRLREDIYDARRRLLEKRG